jgi:hypothetical protein
MKKIGKTYCLFVIAFIISVASPAQQVLINFNPLSYGQSLEGLGLVQLINSYSQDLYVKVNIKIKETHGGMVASISIPGFNLRRGNNTIDRSAFSRSRISFGNNYYGRTLNQSGRFPEGEYEYCFEVDLSESKVPGITPFFENCFIQELKPLTPLLLINPIDGDEDCNKRPQFTWQPPLPLPPGARFRLVLTEIKEKQDVVEAINFNPPVIDQGNIPVNQLNFPFNAPELTLGKTYAWQVIMYTDKVVLKKSEIWIYKVKCEEQLPVVSGDSYREMKESNDGNFYIASKVLRFSFSNPYSGGNLNYSIVNLSNPALGIKDLPKLSLQPGLNKYDVDLRENKAFRSGDEYMLTVQLPNGRNLRLRFIYKNE